MPKSTSNRIHGPTSHSYFSQRLRLHYVDWGNEEADNMLLVHGGRDHCRNWDWVAQALRADYHIIAPDLRGHGDSQWLVGGAYSTPEIVYDISQLVRQTKIAPTNIIAHSWGGAISLLYAGLYPENVKKLVVIEGLGPAPEKLKKWRARPAQERLRDWMDRLQELSGRTPRRYASIDDAYARMQEENPHLRPDQARHLTIHGANQNEDGTYSWKFDNYMRANAPFGMDESDVQALWQQINCPVLLIRGTESWASDPNEDGRIQHFKNAASVTAVNVEKAGHWVHHDQLDIFLGLVREFMKG